MNAACVAQWRHMWHHMMSKTSLYSIVLFDLPIKNIIFTVILWRSYEKCGCCVVRDSMRHVMRITCHMCHVLSHVMINVRYPYLHSQSVPDSGSGSGLHGKWIIGAWISAVGLVWCHTGMGTKLLHFLFIQIGFI